MAAMLHIKDIYEGEYLCDTPNESQNNHMLRLRNVINKTYFTDGKIDLVESLANDKHLMTCTNCTDNLGPYVVKSEVAHIASSVASTLCGFHRTELPSDDILAIDRSDIPSNKIECTMCNMIQDSKNTETIQRNFIR